MTGCYVRGALVAVALVAIPVAPARACHLFDRCCGRPTTTFYAPTVANFAPACCPAPQPCAQVVNYMPQTCYRTVIVNTPVVSYCPTTACDPCGRATTVMRPITTFVARPTLVPYTTYRPVVTRMPVAQPCCPTPTAVAVPVAPAIQTAPACCSPASATTVVPAPPAVTTVPVTPAPAPAAVAPGATLQPVTPAPSLNGAPPAQPNQTFEASPSDAGAPQSRVLMPPSASSFNGPRGLDPETQDRTTAIPLRRSFAVRQASLTTPVSTPTVDADGWRAGK